jgi:hypothetical protein
LTTLENHEGNVGHSNTKLTYGRDAREWRRSLVLDLDSQGYSHREIVTKLHISKSTVSNDLIYLRRRAQDNLQHHIHKAIPEYYQKCLWGMKRILKQTLEIGDASQDPKIKLEAMKIASECYRHLMDLTTNGSIVTDAIKYVTQTQNDVNVLKRLDESIKADEEGMTNSGVF